MGRNHRQSFSRPDPPSENQFAVDSLSTRKLRQDFCIFLEVPDHRSIRHSRLLLQEGGMYFILIPKHCVSSKDQKKSHVPLRCMQLSSIRAWQSSILLLTKVVTLAIANPSGKIGRAHRPATHPVFSNTQSDLSNKAVFSSNAHQKISGHRHSSPGHRLLGDSY